MELDDDDEELLKPPPPPPPPPLPEPPDDDDHQEELDEPEPDELEPLELDDEHALLEPAADSRTSLFAFAKTRASTACRAPLSPSADAMTMARRGY